VVEHSQLGLLSPIYAKMKNVFKPPTRMEQYGKNIKLNLKKQYGKTL
jgi:hypothetical protein